MPTAQRAEIRVWFTDEITSSQMYRTFATMAAADHAIAAWLAHNTPEQYPYYKAAHVGAQES
jgi:hypothetical protein